MAKNELGAFEHVVLLSVLRLGDGAYGALIRMQIESATGRAVTIGAVHATLQRLERKGFLSSWIGDSTAVRGGKAKRHFKVEASGEGALKRTQATLERLHAAPSLQGLPV